MNDRERAINILKVRGEPIEPNEWTEELIKDIVKQIRFRRKKKGDKQYIRNLKTLVQIVKDEYVR